MSASALQPLVRTMLDVASSVRRHLRLSVLLMAATALLLAFGSASAQTEFHAEVQGIFKLPDGLIICGGDALLCGEASSRALVSRSTSW